MQTSNRFSIASASQLLCQATLPSPLPSFLSFPTVPYLVSLLAKFLYPFRLNDVRVCVCVVLAGAGRVSARSVLPSTEAETTAVDYAEQLLAPGMPPLDEIKDLKVCWFSRNETDGEGRAYRGVLILSSHLKGTGVSLRILCSYCLVTVAKAFRLAHFVFVSLVLVPKNCSCRVLVAGAVEATLIPAAKPYVSIMRFSCFAPLIPVRHSEIQAVMR